MEIIPQGTIHLRLGDEHFEWCVISRVVSAVVSGTEIDISPGTDPRHSFVTL